MMAPDSPVQKRWSWTLKLGNVFWCYLRFGLDYGKRRGVAFGWIVLPKLKDRTPVSGSAWKSLWRVDGTVGRHGLRFGQEG